MPIRLPLLLAAALLLLILPAGARAAGYVPDEVIVHYEQDTGGGVAAQVAAEAGTEPVQALPGGSEQLQIHDGESVGETIAELKADPNVAYAVPNWRAHASAEEPNDPYSRLQWNLFGEYGINTLEAWTLAEGMDAPAGRRAVVALIDSGVAYERYGRYRRAPDLRHSTFVRPYDFVGKDRHPNDVYGHGTHVAGTIAQTTNNRIGTAGIAYNAQIMPLQVLDSIGEGDTVAIARAIRYAARYRVDVINLSIEFPAELRAAQIPDVLSALRYAHQRGVLVVAASGNESDIAVAYPARAQSVVAVGATTVTGCQADYSNSGEDLDLAAPGGGPDAPNTDSEWDDAHCRPDSFGRPILQQTFTRGVRRFGWPRDYVGTSMASAHVSAVAALVIATKRLGAHPSPRDLEKHLEATARPAGRADRYGAGLVDAAAALR
jgi:serine protease